MSNDFYKNSNLIFESNKIITEASSVEVMMDWEAPMMQEHANIVCHNQGDILEIGFGLGISADYIQALNPTSHTIVEIHPQIYSLLETWATDKPNVTIHNADWFDIQESLGQYDGIFYDGFGDFRSKDFAQTFVPNHIKVGGKFTYYNDGSHIDTVVDQEKTTYSPISVNPDPNGYFSGSTYYIPTVQY